MAKPLTAATARGRPSLRLRLLLGLYVIFGTVLAGFMLWDYNAQWDAFVQEKQSDMRGEAELVFPAVKANVHDPEALQAYINDVTVPGHEVSSRGHYIAIFVDGKTFQSLGAGAPDRELLSAMATGMDNGSGLAQTSAGMIIVGGLDRDGIVIRVAEPFTDVQDAMRGQIVRRALSILVLALAIAASVYVLIHRMVTKPLRAVAASVRKVRAGELGTQIAAPPSAELAFLADEFNSMTVALAEADRDRRFQMAKARRIQERLIPDAADLADVGLQYIYLPASEVGGDYFDVYRRGSTVLLCVADVSGHGVPAAMGAAMLKTLFQAAAAVTDDPREIIRLTDQGLANVSLEGDFVSMIVVALDLVDGEIRYANAGHEPGYLLGPSGGVRLLSPTGAVLGIPESTEWETVTRWFAPGDRLVMVTDGLIEMADENDRMFGRERLLTLLEDSIDQDPAALRAKLLATIAATHAYALQRDDITVVMARLEPLRTEPSFNI
jgi:sigma-B regulation protein RsbU (phosphoserine phosphatase)